MASHHIYKDPESGMRIEVVVPWGDAHPHTPPATVTLEQPDGTPWPFEHEQSV